MCLRLTVFFLVRVAYDKSQTCHHVIWLSMFLSVSPYVLVQVIIRLVVLVIKIKLNKASGDLMLSLR